MKEKLSKLILKFYKLVIGREACILYRRPTKYTIKKDWFSKECPFCSNSSNLIKEYNNFKVIENNFPYPNAENHFLIVPKRHLISLDQFSDEEKKEWLEIFNYYLNESYLIFNRQFWKHKDASVEHFHTHAFK